MGDPRLFEEDFFVVTRAPGTIGRSILKLARHVDIDPRFWVRDRGGRAIAEVVPTTNRLRKAIDGYTRHDVVDVSGRKLLDLRQLPRLMYVEDGDGVELGIAFHDRRVGPTFHRARQGNRARDAPIISRLPPVIGRTSPITFGRYELVFGVIEITDADGPTVASITNTDGRHNVVRIAPAIERPLRLMTIVFACSLVKPVWLHPPLPRR